MKSTKHFLLFIIALFSINLNAQEVPPVTINVATAGTLPQLIASSQKYQITNLTLTGYLNGTDILYIREMAGKNDKGNATIGKLSVLDLSNAQILPGGKPYLTMNIFLYSSLNTIGDYAFSDCNLTSVIIPNSVTTIGSSAFWSCRGLTTVTIPNSVTSIGESAFGQCTRLTSITIPNSVTSIGNYAFYGCNLTSVIIPNSVTTIGEGVFNDCTVLTSVTIPNSVTSIGGSAFSYSGLESITIPNSVTSIGEFAFGRSRLTSITIPNSVTSIGEKVFYECTGLTSVTIPNSVTSIGYCAFYGCKRLISATIPNSVTSIGESAFKGCSGLTSITIPNSVTSIGFYAFMDCSQIKQIYCEGTTPPEIDSSTFFNLYKTCKLYVPKGAYSAYRKAPNWSYFTYITEQVTTSISNIESSNTNVYTDNGSIIVKGGKLGDTVDIYSVSGSLLHKIKITDDIVRISVAPQSLYIVKTGDKSFKIAL